MLKAVLGGLHMDRANLIRLVILVFFPRNEVDGRLLLFATKRSVCTLLLNVEKYNTTRLVTVLVFCTHIEQHRDSKIFLKNLRCDYFFYRLDIFSRLKVRKS